jgi:glycosyltransferase involved in cell wall biosynthesis
MTPTTDQQPTDQQSGGPVQTRTHEFVYVLEQTLGNIVHGNNVLRVAAAQPDVSARCVPVHYDATAFRRRVPVLGNWTLDASRQARRGVLQALAARPADALFVNTQCCAHLLHDVMRKVPTVVSMDATPVNFDSVGASYEHRTRSQLVEQAKLGAVRTALTAAAAITTWSHWAAASVIHDYGIPATRVRVIRPGVRLDRFHPPASQRPAGGLPRLLFVGGDFARKGGYDLLAAMDRLGPVAELDIVTSAPPAPTPPWARVHTGLGHDSTELFNLYQRADIFVVPSRGDVYGLVYPEAMACGLPVVACDVGAARELVVQRETGLLVPPGSPDELAEALRILIESPDLRASMGARGLQLAREQHDADRTCGQIVDLMREVAAGWGGAQHPDGRPGVVGAAPGVTGAGSGMAGAPPGTRPAGAPRPLLLVSASIGPHLRDEVKAGERPCPEYLRLEQDYDVLLVEWAPGGRVQRRSPRALQHTTAALGPVRQASAVLSDGEHAGIPLAMAMWAARVRTPHVMIGHHLTTRSKLAALRYSPALRRIDRILVHSANQAATLTAELGVPPARVHVVPYGIDTDFWQPQGGPEQDLVVSAGREHRDYATLASACAGEPVRVYIADGSSHSPGARLREPGQWPGNVERGSLGLAELRDRYAAACVVVVPVAPTDFPAGVTTLLEAMSMGKAVVVTGTEGLQGIVQDASTGLVVRPGDVAGLRAAVRRLREDPDERTRLGRAARQAVLERWSLGSYVDQLGRHLQEVCEAAARGGRV